MATMTESLASTQASEAAGERPDIQKKVFGRWINWKLQQGGFAEHLITDLYFDLQNGESLLDLVSVLTHKDIKREQGSIRVHKLRNVDVALTALREERVKLSEAIHSAAIVDGDAACILALCWAIILHWQFLQVLQQSSSATFQSAEKLLYHWCQSQSSTLSSNSSHSTDFIRQLADGQVLCQILHRHKPTLFDMDLIKAKSPRERLEFLFRLMGNHFGVPKILDTEDVHTLASDKKAVMTYVMCMLEALLRSNNDLGAALLSDENQVAIETVQLGSPLKKNKAGHVKSGKLLDYDTFCHLHEDVLEWLLEAEDKLKSMLAVSDNLMEAKRQFDDNAEYMSELDTHQKVVGEVIRKGRHLLSSPLTSAQEKDVKVRQKLLIDRWEGLRQQALERQNSLHEKLMELQRQEMQRLRNWMTETEDKISRMTVVGCTLEAIEQEEKEHNQLEKSLEDQHDTVHSISNFIYVETTTVSGGSGDNSSSNSSKKDPLSSGQNNVKSEMDLEGQLMALGERWTVLCTWVEERAEILRITRDELELLEREKDRLTQWLDKRGNALREMDRNPSDNPDDLLRQGQLIAVILDEWQIEKKAMLNINSVAEKLVSCCLRSLPENETPNEAIKADSAAIGKTVETIQDRWDILTAILEAQKQRVARQGIEMDKIQVSSSSLSSFNWKSDHHPKDDYTSSGVSSGGEENTPKKRKITGTKRIEFEAMYAKLCTWLQKSLQQLETAQTTNKPQEAASSSKELELHYDNLYKLNEELKAGLRIKVCEEAIALGQDLMCEIQSETDYPAEYLNNVTDKVQLLRQQMTQLENANVPEILTQLAYWRKKKELYQQLEDLSKMLHTLEKENHQEELNNCQLKLKTHMANLEVIKELAQVTLLHPGAIADPGNSIKTDLYTFCDRFEALEQNISEYASKTKSNTREDNEAASMLEKTMREHTEALEAITLWMEEVSPFLIIEDATFGDIANLESQFNDSQALVADVETLLPKLDEVRSSGTKLLSHLTLSSQHAEMSDKVRLEMEAVTAKWQEITQLSKAQNARLKCSLDKSKELVDSVNEIQSFVSQLKRDLPNKHAAVTQPAELSQRTFKLLHFKDKIERKRGLLDKLLETELERENQKLLKDRVAQVEKSWKLICEPVIEEYHSMKSASSDYGEFKTLQAQESDWMERLEKKLQKSTNTAADAEEISEELNEIEHFLDNHPQSRLERIKELAHSLATKNIQICHWQKEAEKLVERWTSLKDKAKTRTALLEKSITEAQEWEYKLIAVQDWLTERDILLTSHLEHELTVDDLPDESQVMLREFEDQENLLAEMDEQVDAYRAAGKHEAAVRLEDQLLLIHQRFQELSMKFELFQKQPEAVEYEPRLGRVARQLRDIKEKLYLTELASAEKEGIEGQLHHARCIQNALSDIKAEVGNLIKIGRRILEHETFERKLELKEKIDALEKDYHEAGCEVICATRKLNEALSKAERVQTLSMVLEKWLTDKLQSVSKIDADKIGDISSVRQTIQEMLEYRSTYEEISKINGSFFQHCNASLLTTLKESMTSLDEKWNQVHDILTGQLTLIASSQSMMEETEISTLSDNLAELKLGNQKRKLSDMQNHPEKQAPLLDDFRTAFQEVSVWINKAEAQLNTNRQSQERQVGQEIDDWARAKMSNLRQMAEKLVELFVKDSNDVEPEMASLHLRWQHIVQEVEKRLGSHQAFRMVEVEEIKTTISHLSITTDTATPSMATLPDYHPDEEIETLIEEDEEDDNESASAKQSRIIRFTDDNRLIRSSDSLSNELHHLKQKKSSPQPPPPEPLPKPKWYLEQRAQGLIQMPMSPEKVKVIQNTLPSPQKLVGKVEKTSVQAMEQAKREAEKTIVVQQQSSTSVTISEASSPSALSQSIMTDEDNQLLAKENAMIDHLLAETELQLEEVARHVRGLEVVKDKEHQEFENCAKALMEKLEAASRKVDQVDGEEDIKLRRDLINMDLKVLESEFNSVIGRGDKALNHLKHSKAGKAIEDQLREVRIAWRSLKSRAEQKKTSIVETEVKLKQFKREVDESKRWLTSSKVKMVRAMHDDKVLKQFVLEVRNRKSDVEHLNLLASQLKHRNAFAPHEMTLNIINADWEEILEGIKPLVKKMPANGNELMHSEEDSKKLLVAPGSPMVKAAPATEVAIRMSKMLDALAAIERQLDTQTLSLERPCENLQGQSEALSTAKNALERLRPSMKQTDQDLDRLSNAHLSMEYFEKLSNSSSRLHKEWDKVRFRYAQRQDLWNKCQVLQTEMDSRRRDLQLWLRQVQAVDKPHHQISNEEIEKRGKLAAELTSLGKEFMSQTSAQEAVEIQTEIDAILRQWKNLLSVLTTNSEQQQRASAATASLLDKVDKLSTTVSRPINCSDGQELQAAISQLENVQDNIGQLRSQIVGNHHGHLTADDMKMRTAVERLAISVPRKLEMAKEKWSRLTIFVDKKKFTSQQIKDLVLDLDNKSNGSGTKQFRAMNLKLTNLQYDVNRLFNDYACLEREVANSSQLEVEASLAKEMQELKRQWLQVSAEIRQLATSSSTPLMKNGNASSASVAVTTAISTDSVATSGNTPFATLSSPQSSNCVSPTTCSSQSSFASEENIEVDDNLVNQIERELQEILEEATQLNLSVDEPKSIRIVVEKQQNLMKQLESKRDHLENVSCKLKLNSSPATSSSSNMMQSRLGILRDQLDVSKHRILSRKSECAAMVSDSEQYARKLHEIESWLKRLDGILTGTYPTGQTLDILEDQHSCTMDALKELSKYEHHVKLFMQVCERMSHVYARDNTSQIQAARHRVEEKHGSLVKEFTKRRDEIQTMQNSFASFDKSVERFFEWLFDLETTVEQLEEDCSSGSVGSRNLMMRKFEDIKNDIHDKDRVFQALTSTGTALMEKMACEEKTMLGQKLSEMSSRWKSLQNKMLDINLNLQPTNDQADLSVSASASSESLPHISIAHAQLRDHLDWVLRKKRELASLSLDGDVKGLRRQNEEHAGFKHHLGERGSLIRRAIEIGEKLILQNQTRQDFTDCLETLDTEWRELLERSSEWQDDILRMMENVKAYEDKLKELNKLLQFLEEELTHIDSDIESDLAKATALRDQLHDRAETIVQLSHANRRDLEDLDRRLESAIRQKPSLEQTNASDLDPTLDQTYLNAALLEGWERGMEDGIPYFINHREQRTQWDHPEFTDLMESLLEMNTVKFSVYRMALKLRKVQQKLCLDLLDLKSALVAFNAHGLTKDKHDSLIKVPQMVVVLTSIYEALHEEEPEEIQVALCVDLCLNWLLNVYDTSRTSGQLRVLSFKIGLLVLCRGPLTEKYTQLFHLISEHGHEGQKEALTSPRPLALLLYDCIQIPKYLAEVAAFGGSDIEPSVRSCFKDTDSEAVNCKQFLLWLQKEPQSMVWLPVLHRLSAAETATHNIKCRVCKIYPIVGFRYHCLKCFNFDLCHNCFFVGRTAKGHKADHPIQEYCTSTGRSANLKFFGQAIRNSFRTKKYFKKKQGKLGYLPVGALCDGQEFTPSTVSPNVSITSKASREGDEDQERPGKQPPALSDINETEVGEDEHHLIAEYCRMIQDQTTHVDNENFESHLKELESERRSLLAEYRDLYGRVGGQEQNNLDDPEDKVQELEAKQLRQQTSRMETRMQILLDHNQQLEQQLKRLRQLVQANPAAGEVGSGGQFGTLQSKSIVAQDLNIQSPNQTDMGRPIAAARLPPPLTASQDILNGGTSDEDDDNNFNGSHSSLDLSAHEMPVESD